MIDKIARVTDCVRGKFQAAGTANETDLHLEYVIAIRQIFTWKYLIAISADRLTF